MSGIYRLGNYTTDITMVAGSISKRVVYSPRRFDSKDGDQQRPCLAHHQICHGFWPDCSRYFRGKLRVDDSGVETCFHPMVPAESSCILHLHLVHGSSLLGTSRKENQFS